MRHYYTTLNKAREIAAMASRHESAVYEIVGCGYLVGRTAYADELKYCADTGMGITARLVFPQRAA